MQEIQSQNAPSPVEVILDGNSTHYIQVHSDTTDTQNRVRTIVRTIVEVIVLDEDELEELL